VKEEIIGTRKSGCSTVGVCPKYGYVLYLITIFYGFNFRALLATPLRMPQVVESPKERTAG